MKKMLKRADGSKSRRGLWDNIRANKGSGKQPTKEMLKQEKKIKAKKYFVGGPGDPPVTTTPAPAPKIDLSKSRLSSGSTAGSGSNFGQKQACVGQGCGKVIAAGSSYAGVSGSNYTGPGGAQLSMKPTVDPSRIVHQTPEEKAAGLANQAKYQAEGDARMAAKRYEAALRSGKGDLSTGMDPEMIKDKGTMGTKFYSRQKTGGKKSNWMEESKELKFGGPSKKKYLDGGPDKTATTKLDANGFDANGFNPKTKKYTDAANKERLKQVFAGTHTTDPRDQTLPLIPKPKKPMADISTAGLKSTAPAESTNVYTKRLKSGGKKKMGGKNC